MRAYVTRTLPHNSVIVVSNRGPHEPRPEGGGILKSCWWRFWQPRGAKLSPIMVRMADGELLIEAIELPDEKLFDQILQSWDCAFKDVSTSDYVVGQVWAKKGADRFLLDQVRDRMDCPKTIQEVRKLSMKWPRRFAPTASPLVRRVIRGSDSSSDTLAISSSGTDVV